MIAPDWNLLFSTKRGPWWVRLLACGRYNHVKAIAYLPMLRAWLLYDVKFNGTRLMLAQEDDPATAASLHAYLDGCDAIALPGLAVPKRIAPHLGFWCTLAMKHLVGIRTATLRPDSLWRDCIAAGGRPFVESCDTLPAPASHGEPTPSEALLAFLKAHAQSSSSGYVRQSWLDEAAFGRRRSDVGRKLRIRLRGFWARAITGRRRPPLSIPSSARC